MNIPPYGDAFKKALLQFANLKVKAQNTPDMTIYVSPGGFWYYTSSGSSYIEFAGGSSGTISVPTAPNKKWTLVTLNTSGNIVIIDGTAAPTPDIPAIPRGRICLAAIYIQNTDTTISEDMIFDMRPVFELSVKDHRDLQNNSLAASHPASAIMFTPGASGLVSTNLQDVVLELKILFDDLYVHAGSSGTSGTAGTSGIDGTSGTAGTSGSSGTSGFSGTSGSSGTTGSDGTSGIDGTSGTSGIDGTSGSSGTTGTDGTSGSSGTTGTDGTSGSSGTTGTDGTSGSSGTSGTDGTSGTSA